MTMSWTDDPSLQQLWTTEPTSNVTMEEQRVSMPFTITSGEILARMIQRYSVITLIAIGLVGNALVFVVFMTSSMKHTTHGNFLSGRPSSDKVLPKPGSCALLSGTTLSVRGNPGSLRAHLKGLTHVPSVYIPDKPYFSFHGRRCRISEYWWLP